MRFNSHSAYSPTPGCFQGDGIGGWGLPESEFLCWKGLHVRAMGPLGISAQALQFVSLGLASDLCHQQQPASSPVTLTNLDCSVTWSAFQFHKFKNTVVRQIPSAVMHPLSALEANFGMLIHHKSTWNLGSCENFLHSVQNLNQI